MGVRLEDVAKIARDGVTTSVGLGLLVFQQAQVQRRELMRSSGKLLQTVGAALENRVKMVEERLNDLNERRENSNNKN